MRGIHAYTYTCELTLSFPVSLYLFLYKLLDTHMHVHACVHSRDYLEYRKYRFLRC